MKIISLNLVLLFLLSCSSALKNPSKVKLLNWGSGQSFDRLTRSQFKADFFKLSNFFVSQDNKIYCGLASSAIVLNALKLGSSHVVPVDNSSILKTERDFLPKSYDPFFAKYTQNNVLNRATKSKRQVLGKPVVIAGKEKSDYGLQLKQLARVLESNGATLRYKVVTKTVNDLEVRKELLKNLKSKNDYVLVNYSRSVLGQKGGGHISPVAAYDQASDSFLVMDVNVNKAPWVWVDASLLISAMRTFDTVENRGYLLVSN